MTRNLDDLTDAELAEWQYAYKDELDAQEGGVVDVEVSPQFSVTMSFRLPGDEADAIRHAAGSAGISLSEWIRRACADALEDSEGQHAHLQVATEIDRAVQHLDVTRRVLEAAKRLHLRTPSTTTEASRPDRPG